MYHLSILDYSILAAFGLAIVAITVRCAQKSDTSDDYFLAGCSSPGWVIGLSFLGTSISSLSFLAFPAAAYKGNWTGLVPFLVIPLVAIVADRVCLPLYRRLGITSGYEYLELRFGLFARCYGSIMFLLLQLARAGLIMVLLSLPLSLMTGLSQGVSIALCGVFTTLYVLFGGLKAVLWTDVLQTVLLAAGAVFCVVWMCSQLPEGLTSVLEIGGKADKFSLPPWLGEDETLLGSLASKTMVVLLLNGIFNQLLYYTADQNIIQRYLATRSDRQARVGLWIGSIGIVPMLAMFTFMGTCLFVYYATFPDPKVIEMSAEADKVFPHFILTQLPSGVLGLIIAALIAAAMSSLDSNLNAISMVFQIDIYRRLIVKDQSERHYLKVAKVSTLVFGAIVTIGALALSVAETETLLDLMFLVYAVFAGGLAGLFLLGMLSRRANTWGVNLGIIVSVVVNIYLTCSYFECIPKAYRSSTHPYLIGVITNTVLLLFAYGASLINTQDESKKSLEGLTVWSNNTRDNKTTS